MPLIHFVIILAVVGAGVWLLVTKVPMPPWLRQIIIVASVVVIGYWVLQQFGIIGSLTAIRVPRLGS